jgi:hypothetical protein
VEPYRPLGHGAQAPALPRLYRPTGQIIDVEFVEPAGHMYPGAQAPLQVTDVSWVALPKVPGGQRLHAAAAPTLYVPAGHSAQ